MLNCAIIMGRLTADPELKTTQSGISVTSFSVAVDRNYTPKGQERQTDFINVVAWRQTAEFVTRYFHKGSMRRITSASAAPRRRAGPAPRTAAISPPRVRRHPIRRRAPMILRSCRMTRTISRSDCRPLRAD